MLINRKGRIAIIHLARKDRGLDEVAYRALLHGAAGIESAAEIESEAQFEAVMQAFIHLGFRRAPAPKKRLPLKTDQVGNLASERQLYYIKGLWELASKSRSEESLRVMVRRIGKVDDLRFLTKRAASALIIALRDIAEKAGFDPDRGPAPCDEGARA